MSSRVLLNALVLQVKFQPFAITKYAVSYTGLLFIRKIPYSLTLIFKNLEPFAFGLFSSRLISQYP
jgi:hypothetical protein